jgi:hypothetical protein
MNDNGCLYGNTLHFLVTAVSSTVYTENYVEWFTFLLLSAYVATSVILMLLRRQGDFNYEPEDLIFCNVFSTLPRLSQILRKFQMLNVCPSTKLQEI